MEKVNIAEGERGRWSVSKFQISKKDSERSSLRAMMHGRGYVPPGTYTRITRGGKTIMTDTPDEMRDHMFAVQRARGRVLINGLGIGMVLANVLRRDSVEHVTVVELDADVIALVCAAVALHVRGARLMSDLLWNVVLPVVLWFDGHKQLAAVAVWAVVVAVIAGAVLFIERRRPPGHGYRDREDLTP